MIRCLHDAVAVPGLAPPYDTVHLRVFHRADRGANPAETQTGLLAARRDGPPRPVVLVLPGVNIGPEGYRWLAERWVAEGFVVVTVALVGELGGGHVGITPGIDLEACRPGIYGTRPTSTVIAPVVELLQQWAAAGPLQGVIDPTRVVLAGYSAGGTLALQNSNPEWFPVVATVTYASHTMASTSFGWSAQTVLPVPGDVELPTLMLGGELDGVVAASSTRYTSSATDEPPEDHDPVERTFLEALGSRSGGSPSAYLGVVRGGTHTVVLDPTDTTTGRGFLDPPPGRPAAAVRETIGDLSVEFLAAHVLGREASHDRLAAVLDDRRRVARSMVR